MDTTRAVTDALRGADAPLAHAIAKRNPGEGEATFRGSRCNEISSLREGNDRAELVRARSGLFGALHALAFDLGIERSRDCRNGGLITALVREVLRGVLRADQVGLNSPGSRIAIVDRPVTPVGQVEYRPVGQVCSSSARRCIWHGMTTGDEEPAPSKPMVDAQGEPLIGLETRHDTVAPDQRRTRPKREMPATVNHRPKRPTIDPLDDAPCTRGLEAIESYHAQVVWGVFASLGGGPWTHPLVAETIRGFHVLVEGARTGHRQLPSAAGGSREHRH